MTLDTVFASVVPAILSVLPGYLSELSDESSLRLNAVDHLVTQTIEAVRSAMWDAIRTYWKRRAEQVAAYCPTCGHKCEREERTIAVTVSGQSVPITSVYFYCRPCHRGNAPLANWLGLCRGKTSIQFERHLVALSTEMSFHQAGGQMGEQHGQIVDAGKAERVTYSVARDAVIFLQERHAAVKALFEGPKVPTGVNTMLVTTDGGGAPVGELFRPPPVLAVKLTPKRHLPQGEREQTHREMRLIVAHALPHEHGERRSIDVHVAPLEHPEVSGDRMLATARLAGMGMSTHVHGVFDGGSWIKPQFIRVFGNVPHSICLDKPHVIEYLGDASKALFPTDGQPNAEMRRAQEKAQREWLTVARKNLQDGTWATLVQNLKVSTAEDVVAARKYVENHHEDMPYSQYEAAGLPVGSGEAEGGIRHEIRARFDNAGVWREDHLSPMGALESIRGSGWWDEFWTWREERDIQAFRARQRGENPRTFRGRTKSSASEEKKKTA